MNDPRAQALRVGVDALADFADRVDVRSPAEFALDHVPGATNHPVLDDAERARIGTLYASSPFAARRLGAALVARNIAAMLDTAFAGQPRDWRPLVYCWRGGQRSRALAHVLNEIGWHARQLDGGYRSYRRQVVAGLVTLPAQLEFVVIGGLTGSGKSRLLRALEQAGAQTLDLEALARHRGSLLGDLPEAAQPSQKAFETAVHERLQRLDVRRPVYVEAESRRLGALQVPDALLDAMRAGRGLTLSTPLAARVALLRDDYAHFVADQARLLDRLRPLTPLHGKDTLAQWAKLAERGDWDALVAQLLETHYDPSYTRSLRAHYAPPAPALELAVRDASHAGFAALAQVVRNAIEADLPAPVH